MEQKKLYIHVIVSGLLLVIASLFIVLAMRGLKGEGDIAQTKDIILIAIGTVLFIASMINILYIAFKILKEKKIIYLLMILKLLSKKVKIIFII